MVERQPTISVPADTLQEGADSVLRKKKVALWADPIVQEIGKLLIDFLHNVDFYILLTFFSKYSKNIYSAGSFPGWKVPLRRAGIRQQSDLDDHYLRRKCGSLARK